MIELGAQGVAIEDSMDYVGNVDRFGEIFPEVEQQEEIVVTAYYPETVIFRMSSVIDKQKSLGKLICTPFTGQTSKGGIYYALLI